MKKLHLFAPVWLAVQYSSRIASTQAATAITSSFDQFMQSQVQDAKIVGVGVAAVHAGSATEYGAWGRRNEEGDNMTADTLNSLGSLGKAFTATAMGILIDDFANGRNTTALPAGVERLEWETKVKDLLLNEWELMDSFASEKANLRDLLSHLTGVARTDLSFGPGDTLTDVTQAQKYFKPAYELRERWAYNSQMYIIASHIIATYSDAGSFTKFVKDRIFTPLNMSSSTYSGDTANQTGKFSQGFTSSGRRIPYWSDDVAELLAGAGGVISSMEDITKWIQLHMNAGIDPVTNRTIHPGFNETTTSRAIVTGNSSFSSLNPVYPTLQGYGLGWARMSYQGHDVVWHNGALPGFNSILGFLPNDGFGFAAVINTDIDAIPTIMEVIMLELLSNALNLPSVTSSASNSSLLANSSSTSSRRRSVPILGAIEGDLGGLSRAATNNSTDYDLSGTYSNPGYGNITFCDASSTSSSCQELLANFTAVDAQGQFGFNVSAGELVASWGKVFSPQVRLVPTGDVASTEFAFYSTALYPHGFGANSTAFEEMIGTGQAVFDVAGGDVVGLGLFGTADEATDQEKEGGTVEETSDAYFVKA